MSFSSIFSQPWWLDAVAPGSWREVIIDDGEHVIARLPYVIKRKYGLTMLIMPPLTQNLGPWLETHEAKYTNQLSRQHKIMSELITKLPAFDSFHQRFHHSVTNWLPFYWSGFQQTTRYTYLIEDLRNVDKAWHETRANIRTDIRKAQRELSVRTNLDLELFLDLNEKTFQRQGLKLPYSRALVARLDRACAKRDCRRIFFAEDSQGNLHAAIYLVWDENAAYYLMGGADPDLRNSGAMSFLIWEAVQFAATVTQSFDFEGSVIEPVERFCRSFGARQKPYFQLNKINSVPLKIYRDVRSWAHMWQAS